MKRVLTIGVFILSAIFVYAQDAAEKINQANQALTAKEYGKAFQLYDEAMKNLGDVQIDASINYNIGFAGYQAEKFQECLAYFDKAIAAGTQVSKSWEFKAGAYGKLNDYAKSVDAYLKAAETSEGGGKDLVYNAAVTAYKGELLDKAVELFTKSVEAGYKGETAQYYKAAVLKKQKKDAEYRQALIEGIEKFPGDKKIGELLAREYVTDGNKLYQQGATILTAANQKVAAGTLKTTDAAYNAEVDKAKEQFKAAAEILEKAVALDAANANAAKLLDACKKSMAI